MDAPPPLHVVLAAAIALDLAACRTGSERSLPAADPPPDASAAMLVAPSAAATGASSAPLGTAHSSAPPTLPARPSVAVLRWNNTTPPVAESFPESSHRLGQVPHGAWMGTDGVVFVVGYVITPSGRDGVVWRRTPSAIWAVSRVQPGLPVTHVYGASSDDVWATAGATLLHHDGKAWSEHKITGLEPGSELHAIWGRNGELWIATSQGDRGTLHRRQNGRWSVETRGRAMRAVTGAGATVWAAGDGAIVRRLPDGTWKTEHADPAARFTALFASAENDVWVVGTSLMRSAGTGGDGKWIPVELPGDARATAVWGRNRTDIHAGTDAGLFFYDTRGWTRVPGLRGSAAIVGSGDELFAVQADGARAP